MKLKTAKLKNKIIAHILQKGNKKTGEKLFLQSCKKLQQLSKKQFKRLIQLVITSFNPTFKIHTTIIKKKKKEITKVPKFIKNTSKRNSSAIQYILQKNNRNKKFFQHFVEEVSKKPESKSILLDNKHLDQQNSLEIITNLKYFKWT